MDISMVESKKLQCQQRDFELLRGLFECRVMTNTQAAALYFEGKFEAAKKRLQKLKSAGLIGERPRHAFEPSILSLTRNGLVALQSNGILKDYPSFPLPALIRRSRVSNLTIRHELEVMNVKTAFHSAIKHLPVFCIEEFSTWPLLNEFKAYRPGQSSKEVLVKPDGFINIFEKNETGEKFERTFFLELDRSTESQDVLVDRVACYHDYYKSGGYAVRRGGTREEYRQFPFRVLIVFKTAERRNNAAEAMLKCNTPILTQVCLSTIREVTEDPLGAIWFRPIDYRNAVQNSQFDIDRRKGQWGYKRQAEREAFIEKHVQKRRILAEE